MNERIREFFDQYEAGVNGALEAMPKFDAKTTAEAFSDCFFFFANTPMLSSWIKGMHILHREYTNL